MTSKNTLALFLVLLIISSTYGQYFSSHDYSALNRVGRSSYLLDKTRYLPPLERKKAFAILKNKMFIRMLGGYFPGLDSNHGIWNEWEIFENKTN